MREKLTELFDNMMKVLFRQEGASLEIGILASEEAQDFIETHASVLNGSFRQVEMSETMRSRLQHSNYVFSGLKTFHELNEAFPSLLDENGNRKTFERFLNDVRKIDKTYNSNYLRAEFNFVQASAGMAAKWEQFMEDGDRYNLQYRTAGDARVRPEHAEMAGITLPPSSPFWREFLPPNGWNCFVEHTPVLTAGGWRFIKDIKIGDLVVGGSGEYRTVVAVHAREVDTELISICTKGAFATCTENHRFLTREGWKMAGELKFLDIIIQVGEISTFGKLVNAINNSFTLGKYLFVSLIRKGETVAPETVDNDIQRRNKKIHNKHSKQFALLEWQSYCRKVEADCSFGYAFRLADGTHSLRVLSARFKRIGQSLGLAFRTEKRGGFFKFFCNLTNKKAVRFCLALSHMLAGQCQRMISGCKSLAGRFTSAGIVNPLRSDSITSTTDRYIKTRQNTMDGPTADSPVDGKPSETALFDKISFFGGISNPAAFKGFNSVYDFFRKTFFHTRYSLVSYKGKTKKTKTTVYNLSIDLDESYIVPIGIAHNCRCTVAQVRKGKYPETPLEEAMERAEAATAEDLKGMFHFNPGIEQKTMPDYNPYTIRRCKDCDIAKGKLKLAKIPIPDNELCEACQFVREIRKKKNERIKRNQEIYDILKNNPDYNNIFFDPETGGVKATHINHNFDKEKGWYEQKVQDAGFKNGHAVILENEPQNIFKQRSCEGLWDGQPFEIAGAETALPSNIRNALKHCASKPDTEVAVIFFPKGNFSIENFYTGLAKFEGLKGTSQYKKFKLIYCIQGDSIIQIKKPS